MIIKNTLLLISLFASPLALCWDVNDMPGDKRSIDLELDEGTWMSLDVSPDGKHIAFDLLGDIYTMPIKGGRAKPIAAGPAWEIQPRFSPDGSRIAFSSDRGGSANIWTMDTDGGAAQALTDDQFTTLNNPTWSADGQFIAARKHYTTWRSLGTGELWLYHLAGGSGTALVERHSETLQKELGEPIFSADGQALYYTANVTPGDLFVYAQDSNGEIFNIKRYDVASGVVTAAVTGAGGAVRPAPSPDGRYLAFVRRLRERSALFIKDLKSGQLEMIYADLDRDMQETWATQGLYPNMDWMPDSRSIVFWAGGKIRSLSIADKKLTTIPFSINQTREVVEPARFKVEVAPDAFHSKMVRWPIVSPAGDRVVFESRGRLYTRQLPKGEASLLTSDGKGNFELFPAWSRDGRWITYVSWSDDKLGSVRRVAAKGGKSRLLSSEPGYYRRPQFSPDGNMVVVEKGVASNLSSPHWSQNPGIYLMPVKGGEMRRLTANGCDPHYGATNDRIFLTRSKNASAIPGARSAGGEAHLVSIGLLDNEERTHAWSDRATRLLVSPDENWVAFRENYHVYAAPLPASPSAVQVGVGDRAKPHKGAFPILKLSADGGQFPAWSAGDRISWSMGPTAWQLDVATAFQPGKLDDYKPPSGGISLATAVAPEAPAGLVALTGGRLITMDGGERVIENGTLLIKGNRIIGLGAAAEVAIPDSAARVDVTGKTLMPGLIDAHAHGPQGAGGLVPQQNWVNLAYLSLGVTTIHDPSNSASEIFTAAEMQRAGQILAPRIFSTGEIVYGARSKYYTIIDSLDDAREHVRRLKSQGAISVKNYNQPRREQRQQVNAAAAEEGLMVVAEGGSLFHLDMSHITDGITGVEHNVPGSMLYGDVMQLWSGTPVGYTLTLNVTYGGPPGENYWYQHTDVWKHPLLARWVPPRVLQPRAVRRMMAPDSEYSALFDSAANGVRLQAAGIDVNIGGHGQREGLGGHWEMWSFARGGMAPMQVLKTATSSPAHYLGMDADLGSLEVGKLADLLILNSNPLENIYDTDKIDKVMLNGRLYQADTLDEVVTGGRRVRDLYWWNSPQQQLLPNGPQGIE